MRIILFFLVTFLFADEKLLIAKFENLNKYYYNHQIVDLKLRVISAVDGDLSITDDMNHTYLYKQDNNGYISDIKFKLNDKFPKFTIALKNNGVILDKLEITINSKIRQLYPPKDFCGILADKLSISDKILASYDDKKNIVYWTINVKNANADDFHLGFENEKLYFLDSNNSVDSYSYSAFVPLNKRKFSFTYFNLQSKKYKTINFNVKLENETVSTQTDIKPMSKNNIYIINILLGIITVLWILLYIYKRKWIYIILILMSISVIIFFNLPKKELILHRGDNIHILPFNNSTTFISIGSDTKVKILLKKDNWYKIEFNKHIGWVKR